MQLQYVGKAFGGILQALAETAPWQECQIVLGAMYQNLKNITKGQQNIPNVSIKEYIEWP
jgi:hypothetical protein